MSRITTKHEKDIFLKTYYAALTFQRMRYMVYRRDYKKLLHVRHSKIEQKIKENARKLLRLHWKVSGEFPYFSRINLTQIG